MAKPHWHHTSEDASGRPVHVFGCQHSSCGEKATWQWQRAATDEEIARDSATQGPYGDVVRSPTGPQLVAVFSCEEHVLPVEETAKAHLSACPAPDEGCECHDGD